MIPKSSAFPIQDVLRLDSNHRMNIPSTSNGNWQFRFEMSQLREEDAQGLHYLAELFNRLPDLFVDLLFHIHLKLQCFLQSR